MYRPLRPHKMSIAEVFSKIAIITQKAKYKAGKSIGRALIWTMWRLSDHTRLGRVPVYLYSEFTISGNRVHSNICSEHMM